MMGMIMPETCSAASVRISNKILQMIVASGWVFYLNTVYLFWPTLYINTTGIAHLKMDNENNKQFSIHFLFSVF
jgi:hypothetical protein